RNDQAPPGRRRASRAHDPAPDPVRRRRAAGALNPFSYMTLQNISDLESSMSNPPLRIRKAAVLGAGVMGAQIAAHLANAGVETLLFDLPAKEGDKNGIAQKAIANLAKLSPAPLAEKSRAAAITPANY